MRGVFTCGVLDCLMDRGVRFPYTIGVSAGACNGLSFMSRQRGRARYSNIALLDKYHYISLKHLICKGNIMDFDLLFDDFPNRIIPYDYPAYEACEERFEMVTTSCRTGRACYFEEKHDPERIIDIVKASSSLPFVSPVSYVDGEPMLDGGIADSIPLLRARELGYDNNLVVLTRNKGYRKQEWISVEERLPDNDHGTHWKDRKYYLVVTAPSGLMSVATYGYKEFGWWVDRCSQVLDEKTYRKVTHWMPLPELPKMKGGAE